jgi:ribosome biogenesis GTPase A
MGKHVAKAAKTGAEPGVTRKLGTPVRIVEPDLSTGDEGVYVVDTPGVFIPYVSDPISMLKLALVGCVKDGLVPSVLVADYLLYQLNLRDPGLYVSKGYTRGPTNSVEEWLDGIARRTGKLGKGGEPQLDQAADWVVQKWRSGGGLGRFVLDEVTEETLEEAVRRAKEPALSMNQAVKREKEERKARSAARWLAQQGG